MNSYYGQKVTSLALETFSMSLYGICVMLRVRGVSRADVRVIEGEVNRLLQVVGEEIAAEGERFQTLIDQHPGVNPISYTAPVNYHWRALTPQDRAFVGLLLALDDVIQLIDALWFAGVIDTPQRTNACHALQRKGFRLSLEAHQIYCRALRSLERKSGETPTDESHADPNPAHEHTAHGSPEVASILFAETPLHFDSDLKRAASDVAEGVASVDVVTESATISSIPSAPSKQARKAASLLEGESVAKPLSAAG